MGWHHPPFEIPKEIYHAWDAAKKAKKRSRAGMRSMQPTKSPSATGRRVYPSDERWFTEGREKTTQKYINELQANPAKIAPVRLRKIRLTLTGRCCLSCSRFGGSGSQQPDHLERFCFAEEDPAGNYIHYGVREFGMTASPTALRTTVDLYRIPRRS